MTTTDRAFIAAIQQSAARWPDGGHAASNAAQRDRNVAPQAPTGAPLSAHLARQRAKSRNRQQAEPDPRPRNRPLEPGVEVDSFTWPEPAERLAVQARGELLRLISAATQGGGSGATPTLAFVGVRSAVGATTTLLAIGKLLADVGGRVALLDATEGSAAASRLGVRRRSAGPDGLDPSRLDDLLVASRRDATTVLALGASPQAASAGVAVRRLAGTHDIVLLDAGLASDSVGWLGALSASETEVLLIDEAGAEPRARGEAATALTSVGAEPAGLVETLASRG